MLYGCQVAKGVNGSLFLQQLHLLTGANIAASEHPVGRVDGQSNWDLETQVGSVATAVIFSSELQSQYQTSFTYSEAESGDISNEPDEPLELTLAEGENRITASTGNGDQEFITVTIPGGFQLDSVVVESLSKANPTIIDDVFIGVQEGTTFTQSLDSDAQPQADLLG